MAFAYTRSEMYTVALIFWLAALQALTPTLRRIQRAGSSKYCWVTTSTADHSPDEYWISWFGEATSIEWCASRATTKPTLRISCGSRQHSASGNVSEVS